jgi:hypothetical protein
MKTTYSSWLLSLLAIETSACALNAEDYQPGGSEESEPAAAVAQPVSGGSAAARNVSSVAVYMYSALDGVEGWNAVGSGTYLGSVDGHAIIATARHCVDDSVQGNPVITHPWDPSYFRVTTTGTPGAPWSWPGASGVEPPGLVTPRYIWPDWWAHPGDNPPLGWDQALIVVGPENAAVFKSGLSPALTTELPGLFFADADELAASYFTECGYGVGDINNPYTSGVLRCSSPLSYQQDLSFDSVLHYRCTSGRACPTEGDSGAGLRWTKFLPATGSGSTRWTLLAGIHKDSQFHGLPGRLAAEMVQWWLGSLTLSRFDNPAMLVDIGYGNGAMTSAHARVVYDSTNHTLSGAGSGHCLTGDFFAGGLATGAQCSGHPLQKWVQTGNLQLRNETTGLCLSSDAWNRLVNVNCAAVAEQGWVFRPGRP